MAWQKNKTRNFRLEKGAVEYESSPDQSAAIPYYSGEQNALPYGRECTAIHGSSGLIPVVHQITAAAGVETATGFID